MKRILYAALFAVASAVAVGEPVSQFQVQIGVVSDETEAQALVIRTTQQGFKPVRAINTGTDTAPVFKVIVGQFDTRQDARLVLYLSSKTLVLNLSFGPAMSFLLLLL